MKHKRSTMEYSVSCVAFALLFLASILPSTTAEDVVQPSANGATVVNYDLLRNFTLSCPLTPDSTSKIQWFKNVTNVNEIDTLKDRIVVTDTTMSIPARATEDDYGLYYCRFGDFVHSFSVIGNPHLKVPPNTNVVEGQRTQIVCTVYGKPYADVKWLYQNSTHNMSFPGTEDSHVSLNVSEQTVVNGVLSIPVTQRSDAGDYTCLAGAASSTTTLRVKDQYAAVWPFLGIVAEVVILCAIILIYEKRRTKPEMEDSDTDNHDQKKS